jgi:peptide-methionine (S)-S-oxide reductase
MTTSKLERAVLAGGCFWGMQDLIRKLPGVVNTRVGYTGGDVPNATYRDHGSHAEAIEIEFDPTRISYRDLLEFFFQIHDPTTLNRQGNDVGTSYRSEIFYVSEAQRDEALRTIDDVKASGLWPGRVVTKVSPAREFWKAEPDHQDYLERYPRLYLPLPAAWLETATARWCGHLSRRERTTVRGDGSRSADCQCFGAGRRPRWAAIVTRSGSDSAFILRMT